MADTKRPRGRKGGAVSEAATATQAEAGMRALLRRYGWLFALLAVIGSGISWAVPKLIDYGADRQAELADKQATRADIDGLKADVADLRKEVRTWGRDLHAALADRNVGPVPRLEPQKASAP